MTAPYSINNEQINTAPQWLAHGGSHADREQTQTQQSPTTASTVATPQPTLKTHGNPSEDTTPPTSMKSSPALVTNHQSDLITSILGLPIGLGEIALALIVAVPVCLLMLKRSWRS
ncbi:hypothetical protein ACSYAD_20690 [Acaryochloris marina NIES-2412]|uniref:hypothetical protein n=1 Tax=Acaryochloris marina TaxID=155978 RepID=UPI00405952DE